MHYSTVRGVLTLSSLIMEYYSAVLTLQYRVEYSAKCWHSHLLSWNITVQYLHYRKEKSTVQSADILTSYHGTSQWSTYITVEYSTVQSADILSSYHGNFLSAADWLNCFHPPSIIFYRNVHTVPGLTQLHSKWKIKPAWHLDIENKYWYPLLMPNSCWHNLVLNSMIS